MAIAEAIPAPRSVLTWYRSRRGWAFVATAWAVTFLLHFVLHVGLNPAVPVLRQINGILNLWTGWGWWLPLLHPAFLGDRDASRLRGVLIAAGILLSVGLRFATFWLGSGSGWSQLISSGPALNRVQVMGILQWHVPGFIWGKDCEAPAVITLGTFVTKLPLDVDTCKGYETYGAIETQSLTFEHRPDFRLVALKATCVHGDSHLAPCYVALWRYSRILGLQTVPLGLAEPKPVPWWADRDAKIRKLLGAAAPRP